MAESILIIILLATIGVVKYAELTRFWRRLLLGLPLLLLPLVIDGHTWLLLPFTVLVISHWRLQHNRYGRKRQRRIVARTARYLLAFTLLYSLITLSERFVALNWLPVVSAWLLLALTARALALTLWRTRRQHRVPGPDFKYPTVTLAIPARNETHALTDTLRAALASDYPKLEILVLDDCSQDATPDIIRSFANDGVRFIQGTEPTSGWIGKNLAYDRLLAEASGELVLFAGVDVRVHPGSIRHMVHVFHQKRLRVLSLMPLRRHFDLWPNLLRPLRYYWQLALAPWPFISSCWMVERSWLLKRKGFRPFKNHIRPERMVADAARKGGRYAFLVAGGAKAVSTRKRVRSLYETAVRTIYPVYGKEPALALAGVMALLAFLYVSIASWSASPDWTITALRFSGLLLLASYMRSELSLQGAGGFISTLFLPLAMLGEMAATLLSLIRYESGSVNWKGRNICMPVKLQRPRERE